MSIPNSSGGKKNSTIHDNRFIVPRCARLFSTMALLSWLVQYGRIAREMVTPSGPMGSATAMAIRQNLRRSRGFEVSVVSGRATVAVMDTLQVVVS